ncbi:MAG: glutaredoxin domain-containing protein [Candidatus Nanopelagicales bacterium]
MATAAITMYSTAWCGDCVRLKSGLTRAGVVFDEIDIESDADAVEFVMSANGGNQTVPTVVFADGVVMGEPTTRQVLDHLAAMGAA